MTRCTHLAVQPSQHAVVLDEERARVQPAAHHLLPRQQVVVHRTEPPVLRGHSIAQHLRESKNSTCTCQESAHEMGNTRGTCALAGRTGGRHFDSMWQQQNMFSSSRRLARRGPAGSRGASAAIAAQSVCAQDGRSQVGSYLAHAVYDLKCIEIKDLGERAHCAR